MPKEKVVKPRFDPNAIPQEKATHEVDLATVMAKDTGILGNALVGDRDPIKRSYFDSPGFKENPDGSRTELENSESEEIQPRNAEEAIKNDPTLKQYDCTAGCNAKFTVRMISRSNNMFQCVECSKLYRMED